MGKKAVSSWAQPQLFQLGKPTDLKSEFKVGFLKFTLWHPSNIHNKESQPTWTDMEQIACNKQHVSVLDIKTSSDHCMVTGELELWASLASPLPAVAARCSGLRTLKVNCIYSVPTGQVDCRPSQTMYSQYQYHSQITHIYTSLHIGPSRHPNCDAHFRLEITAVMTCHFLLLGFWRLPSAITLKKSFLSLESH